MERIELNPEQHERLHLAWREDACDEQAQRHATPSKISGPDVVQILPTGQFRAACTAVLASRGMHLKKDVEFRLQLVPGEQGLKRYLAWEVI